MYVPFFSVILKILAPVAATDVFTFTPGPSRWKLWMLDLSLTTSVYFPAFVGFFMLMVKPGPTVPGSFGTAATTGSAAIAATVTASSATTIPLLMILLAVEWYPREGSPGGQPSGRETRRLERTPREGVVVGPGETADADRSDAVAVLEGGDATLEEREERVEAGSLGRVLPGLRGECSGRRRVAASGRVRLALGVQARVGSGTVHRRRGHDLAVGVGDEDRHGPRSVLDDELHSGHRLLEPHSSILTHSALP